MTTRMWIVAAVMTVTNIAQAYNYSFKELAMNDFEDMEKLVQQTSGSNVIDDSEREPKVREAIKIVMSRKNSDGKRTALFTSLQGQLPETFFQLSVQKVAESAISDMKETTNSNLRKATAFIILENLLAEIQARSADYKGTIELIRDAEIEISDSLRSYRRLEGMDSNESPSSIASTILERKQEDSNHESKPGKVQKVMATINPDFME